MKKLFVLLSAVAVFTSCTENERAKHWGGTEKISLNKNEIVLNVTWKETEMWICTKDTTTGITYFREKSNWGMMEGTVILK
jgi:hypothetical protein